MSWELCQLNLHVIFEKITLWNRNHFISSQIRFQGPMHIKCLIQISVTHWCTDQLRFFVCHLNEGCVMGLCYLPYGKSITCFHRSTSFHCSQTTIVHFVVTFQLLYYMHGLNSSFLSAILKEVKVKYKRELSWRQPSL